MTDVGYDSLVQVVDCYMGAILGPTGGSQLLQVSQSPSDCH